MDEQKPDEELQEEIAEIEEIGEAEVEHQPAPEQPAEIVEDVIEEPAAVELKELPQKLVDQPKHIGAPVPGKIERLKAFIMECRRVLRVTKKPDKQEFYTIVKISAIGIAIIGFIGFLVHFAKELLF